jgi:hypothetical protein
MWSPEATLWSLCSRTATGNLTDRTVQWHLSHAALKHLQDRRAESVPYGRLKSLTSEQRGRDRAADGGNYTITETGVYSLADRVLSASPGGAPFLVVSDLDGTMVGDDATTLRFKQYWETQAVLRGCRLVYSSGRTLVQYLELAQEKEGLLAQPDALISAVGTRVYNYDGAGEWEEDAAWTVRCPLPLLIQSRKGVSGRKRLDSTPHTSLAAGLPPSLAAALRLNTFPLVWPALCSMQPTAPSGWRRMHRRR